MAGKPKAGYLAGLMLVVVVLVSVLLPGQFKKPELKNDYSPGQQDNKLVLAYYDRGWNEETRGLPSFKTHAGGLDLLSPNWYGVDAGGSLILSRGDIEPEIMELAATEEIRVLPLVTNYRGNHQVLASEAALQRAAASIAGMVIENDYAGVNIDFEWIPARYADQLAELVRLVALELRHLDKIVAVSVFPKVDFPQQYHGLHDYEQLAQHADLICLMAYDKHYSRTGPGPVAPLSWTEENIKRALAAIPSEKLILAVAAYGYDWPQDGSYVEPLGLNQALPRARQHQAEIRWDEVSQTPYYQYQGSSGKREVWFESEHSVARKVALVEKYNLAGLAFWRLGYETKSYMDVVRQIREGR